MYYFEKTFVQSSFEGLVKAKVENKLLGLFGILHCIDTDFVRPNKTYKIVDGDLSKWLDDTCYLSTHLGKYGDANLYIKFSSRWIDYAKDNFMKEMVNVFHMIAFLYKYEAFVEKPSHTQLLTKFSKDYHLPLGTVSEWFNVNTIELSFSEEPFDKQKCKELLKIRENTISLSSPFSVAARAGELSRAPFIQTLYAGMDSIKCLLILKDDIDDFYSNRKSLDSMKKKNMSQYRPYITAIKSKPFLLLAGISGTGKSRIVRELARACWEEDSEEYYAQKPQNFEMIQVKPNWHDSSELIGYVSRVSGQSEYIAGPFLKFIAKAWENTEIPYFLCLDEMNLAPVEQYFAEYLSVIESRKCTESGEVTTDALLLPEFERKRNENSEEYIVKDWYKKLVKDLLAACATEKEFALYKQFTEEGIALPPNLIVVGTVNMDETTFSFSRKVLDRAMTLEMNEVNLYGGLTERYESIGLLGSNDLIGTAVEGVDVYNDEKEVCDQTLQYLSAINQVLEGTPFKIAYRTRNEFLLYVVNNLPYCQDDEGNELPQGYVVARALDEITSMKILSRIEGDDTKIKDSLLDRLMNTIEQGLAAVSGEDNRVESISLAKLKEMKEKLACGYTSFWS